MSRATNRLRSSGPTLYRNLTMPQLRRKASHSWSAVKDTYFSAKDIFERHRVVLTLATSMASVSTGLIGYLLHHLHQSRIEQRLERIETGGVFGAFSGSNTLILELNHNNCSCRIVKMKDENFWASQRESLFLEHEIKSKCEISDYEIKKLVTGTVSIPACVATAGTTLFIGYCLGWRGGKWYSARRFRKEQMKLLGQIKPRQWPLTFLKGHQALLGKMKPKRWPLRSLRRPRITENVANTSENVAKDTSTVKSFETARKTSEMVVKNASISSS